MTTYREGRLQPQASAGRSLALPPGVDRGSGAPSRGIDQDFRLELTLRRRDHAAVVAEDGGVHDFRVRLGQKELAESAVVEGAERVGRRVLDRHVPEMQDDRVVDLEETVECACSLEHRQQRTAGRGLDGADLMRLAQQAPPAPW